MFEIAITAVTLAVRTSWPVVRSPSIMANPPFDMVL